MKFDGDTVVFTSTREWFELERDGLKPNTLRIAAEPAWGAFKTIAPTHVRIELSGSKGATSFTRRISWAGLVDRLLGQTIVMVCWEAER